MTRSSAQNVVLFDGQCPMCVAQMKWMRRLDWFHTLRLVPLADPFAAQIAPMLTRKELLEAMHCVTTKGRIHRGARCVRHIGMRVPVLFPLAIILWLPGLIYVADRVYEMISRNRYRLSAWFGCKDACAIPPRSSQRKDAVS